jgi:tripartite-type tricarboxylate transporter receptor subunit TctC
MIMKTKHLGIPVCFLIVFFGFILSVEGATPYPTKAITMMIASTPGASVDLTTRMLAKRGTEILGQPMIPDNNTGGGGFVAMAQVYNAKPDGYTLGVFPGSLLCLEPLLRKAPFDPMKFTPIMTYGAYTFILAVMADAPWKTMKDLVEDTRKNPGKIKLATTRLYSLPNFYIFSLQDQEKIDVKLVPFEGGAPALASTLGRHTDGILSAGSATPHIKEGRMRGLAILAGKRNPAFPDIPTLEECGYKVPLAESMLTVYGPPGLPSDIVRKLDETFKKGAESEDFIKTAKNFEFRLFYWSGEETAKHLREMVPMLKSTLIKVGKLKKE